MTLNILRISDPNTASTLEVNFFEQATRYIYGLEITNTPSAASIKEANNLWSKFLAKIGKTNADIENDLYTNPSAKTGLKTEALNDYKALYTEFLLERLGQASRSNAVNLLSPDEIEARNILFRTFELVLQMLSTLQKNLILVTNAYSLYTKWQNEYIQMMAHTPIYTLSPNNYGQGDANDIGKSLIGGYANVSVSDVIKYEIEKMIADKSTYVTWASSGSPWYHMFELAIDTPGNIHFRFSMRFESSISYNIIDVQVPIESYSDADLRNSLSGILQKGQAGLASLDTYTRQTFVTPWVTMPADTTTAKGTSWNSNIVNPSALKPGDTSATAVKERLDEDKARAGIRGEKNSQLQVFLENARSRKAMVQSSSKPVEDLMTQCRESLQAQANLANTICDTLKGIISAIYRV
jgi:hypothetical protein